MNAANVPNEARLDYMPALRWKTGEILAMRHFFRSPASEAVTPLILIDNVAEREQSESGSIADRIPKDPKKYIDYTASEMQKVFNSRRAFVDTVLFDSRRPNIDGLAEFFNSGSCPAEWCTSRGPREVSFSR